MLHEKKSFRDARHLDKAFYLASDDRFYEPNYAHYRPNSELRSIVAQIIEEAESSWRLHRSDVWTHVIPAVGAGGLPLLPKQGWKIHVSATNLNCQAILEKAARLCVSHGVQFKFANDVETLRLMTSKRWPRGGSGKFITIYPRSESEFISFIELAYQDLKDYSGSFILSDRRYKDCRCLYYRYGGIISMSKVDVTGAKREVLRSPEGEYIYDKRNPYFELPQWVNDIFPEEASDDSELTLNNRAFSIEKALAFSNTGGVYLARNNSSGKEVIIKEARPFVELSASGMDATDRLAQEAKILKIIEDLGVSPKVHSTFWDWENFYLVEEYLDTVNIREIMLSNSPLLLVNPDKLSSEKFYEKYRDIFLSLLEAINSIHSKGVVIGDLSPTNIMVDVATTTVKIIDLEGAFQPESGGAEGIYTPGFRVESKGRKKESNVGDDIYALGAIMMYSMFPIVAMAYLRSDVYSNILPILIRDIGWGRTPVMEIVQGLTSNAMTIEDALGLLKRKCEIESPLRVKDKFSTGRNIAALSIFCEEIGRFITTNYRLNEIYTVFPIDPFGRNGNALGFAFGASGIIYALDFCGIAIPQEALERYQRELAALPADLAPGFLVGAAGMAWGMLRSGYTDAGRKLLEKANGNSLLRSHHSLYYGMAGVGMANLAYFLAHEDSACLEFAKDIAETLEATATTNERGVHWRDEGGVRIGFGYGQSGVALFLLRLSQVTGDAKWRDLGLKALEFDLSYAFEVEPGVMSFSGDTEHVHTLEQYIEQGTGGIIKVCIRYGLWDWVDKLTPDIHRKYSGFPGLIYGLTGFVDVFTDAYVYSGEEKYLKMAERPLEGLIDLYLFDSGEGYAAPGENLFRISCDYATGLAGVLRTFNRRVNLLADEFCLDVLDGKI